MPIRLALLAVLAWGTAACSTTATAPRRDGAPGSVTVRELNVVDEQGRTRVRLGAPLPDPPGLKRAVEAYGIQFLGADGKELGGLAMLDSIGVRGLCFDHEQGFEAMCVGLEQGKPTVTFRQDWKERIAITVDAGVASLTMFDAQGAPRLRFEVLPDGTTRVEGAAPPAGR